MIRDTGPCIKENKMAKKTAAISLADIAVKEPGKSKGKNPIVAVQGETAERIVEYKKIQEEMKALKARQDDIGGLIRDEAKSLWMDRAIAGQTENIKLDAEGEAQLTFIVMDSYAKVSEEAKASIDAAGLGEYIERDQIQLVDDLSEETQARVLKALVAEFGKDRAVGLLQTQYVVKKGSLLSIVAEGSRKVVTAAFELLRPTTQLR